MNVAPLVGEITLPGDKSISHRAAMFSTLANGTSTFTNLSQGGDVKSTISILEKLGAQFQFDSNSFKIHGKGLYSLSGSNLNLDCGNSGTTLRLLTGLLCGQDVHNISLVGDESLSKRPHDRVIKPLRRLGVDIHGREDNFTPIVLNKSQPTGGTIEMNVASAQVKSAILLSGLYADKPTTVIESVLTRNHTELMLSAMGVTLDVKDEGSGIKITVQPPRRDLNPLEAQIPGDPSSAAFFGVASTLIPGSSVTIKNVLLNPTRIGWVEVLLAMGADIEVLSEKTLLGEKVGDLKVQYSPLKAIQIDSNISSMVDELPILSLAMAKAVGTSKLSNAGELRVKESDRISVVVDHLTRGSVQASENADGYEITGTTDFNEVQVLPHGDHRVAMTFSILNYLATGELDSSNESIISTSFPSFFQTFSKLIKQ